MPLGSFGSGAGCERSSSAAMAAGAAGKAPISSIPHRMHRMSGRGAKLIHRTFFEIFEANEV
jgi:hypothetical protein